MFLSASTTRPTSLTMATTNAASLLLPPGMTHRQSLDLKLSPLGAMHPSSFQSGRWRREPVVILRQHGQQRPCFACLS